MRRGRNGLEGLAEALADAFRPEDLSPRARAAVIAATRRLVQGKGVSRAELAEHETGLDELDACSATEIDDEGNIVGVAGLSVLPTAHHFTVDGQTLYTWCALDSLFLPALIGKPAAVQSRCPVSGAQIQLTVTPTGVQRIEPEEAQLALVVPEESPSSCGPRPQGCNPRTALDARELGGRDGTFCTRAPFVSSPEAGARWSAQNPGGVTLSIQEAYEVGREVFILPFLDYL